MARRYLCLFYSLCGGLAGSLEHVFPASLGGLREDRRILCHACQKRFGDGLDKSLPADLRHFNTVLGVESRHRGRVPDAIVTDKLTGHRMWLDEHHQVRSAEPLLVSKHVDEKGIEHREYKHVGELDRDAFLASVKAIEGKTFEITEKTKPRPVLMARTFRGDTSFGSEDTFRAVARVALNFLAAKEPHMARHAFLEPLKRWIYEPNEARSNPFVFFAEPVAGDPFLPNAFEFGHRVALGFCAKTHSVSARVVLFDCYELAVKLGNVECSESFALVTDIDPRAQLRINGMDTREYGQRLEESSRLGDFVENSEAILRRSERRGFELLNAAGAREWAARLQPIVGAINATRGAGRVEQSWAIRRSLAGAAQMAFNCLSAEAERVARQLDAEHPSQAAFFRELVEAVPGDVVVGERGTMLANLVLLNMYAEFNTELLRAPLTVETARNILDGASGRRIAREVLAQVYDQLRVLGL